MDHLTDFSYKQANFLRLIHQLPFVFSKSGAGAEFFAHLVQSIQTYMTPVSVRIWSCSSSGAVQLEAKMGELETRSSHLIRRAFETQKTCYLTDQGFEICVPIKTAAEVLAVIQVFFSSSSADCLEPEILALEILASQLGLLLKPLAKQADRPRSVPILVGKSPVILEIMNMVEKIAPTSATVLIQGESGTGKELIARQLHQLSQRAQLAFVAVNCGTFQETLLESELFGHEKGSFTGAVNQKKGLCEIAHGGTLFLDEIGEMPLSIQAKLLRFLQEGEFYRVGGKGPIRVDVRVISATNRDLEKEVLEGRFREDLYYRINTIALRMPPLRNRVEDIPLFIDHFMKHSKNGGYQEKKEISPDALEALKKYSWPGNIRELQNVIERLRILSPHPEISVGDLPASIRSADSENRKVFTGAFQFSTEMPLEDVEKSHILRTLEYHHGNKTKAAQGLGITIKTLYNKLHRYGVLQSPSKN